VPHAKRLARKGIYPERGVFIYTKIFLLFLNKLNSVMRKYRNSARRNNANGTQGVAPEHAAFFGAAHWRKVVAAGRAYGASRGCADVAKQTYAVAIRAEQNARKAVAGQAARGSEDRYGLADVAEHAFYQAIKMVSHDKASLKIRDCTLLPIFYGAW
jgi:hypothetical protein